jgi:polygalacturonase
MVLFILLLPFVALGSLCNIADFGAVDDGQTLNTRLITRLLLNQSCSEVLVPEGGVYLTGPLNITRSGLTFTVSGTLKASDDASLFPLLPEVPSYPRSRDRGGILRYNPVVLLFNVSNVTVQGNGTIDGSGGRWWLAFHEGRQVWGRPRLFQTMYASNIRLLHVLLKDSPFWTTHIWNSDNVEVGWLRVHSPRIQQNTDGVDPDSSRNVWGHDLDIHQGDDCIAVKSGLDQTGIDYGVPCENVLFERVNCTGNAITIGSEVSGGVNNVTFRNVTVALGSFYACELKTSPARGGFISNILYENVLGRIEHKRFDQYQNELRHWQRNITSSDCD